MLQPSVYYQYTLYQTRFDPFLNIFQREYPLKCRKYNEKGVVRRAMALAKNITSVQCQTQGYTRHNPDLSVALICALSGCRIHTE